MVRVSKGGRGSTQELRYSMDAGWCDDEDVSKNGFLKKNCEIGDNDVNE